MTEKNIRKRLKSINIFFDKIFVAVATLFSPRFRDISLLSILNHVSSASPLLLRRNSFRLEIRHLRCCWEKITFILKFGISAVVEKKLLSSCWNSTSPLLLRRNYFHLAIHSFLMGITLSYSKWFRFRLIFLHSLNTPNNSQKIIRSYFILKDVL